MKHFISKTALYRKNVQHTQEGLSKSAVISDVLSIKVLLRFDMEFLIRKQRASHELITISQVKHTTSSELHQELA